MNVYAVFAAHDDLVKLYPSSPEIQRLSREYMIAVIEMFTKAIIYIHKPLKNKVLSSALRPFDAEFGPFEARLKAYAKSIKAQLTHASHETALENVDNTRRILSHQEDKAKKDQEKHRQRFLRACSTFDADAAWLRLMGRGRSRWLFEEPDYTKWRQAPRSSILWCSGIIGSGKSVLMASVIQELRLTDPTSPRAHFFCQYDQPMTLEYRTLIGAIARQLFDAVHYQAPETLRNCDSDSLAVYQLEGLIYGLPARDAPYYILIDGLDDCLNRQVPIAVSRFLVSLVEQSAASFHIYLSSRQDLPRHLSQIIKPDLQISTKNGNLEQQAYIRGELARRVNQEELSLPESSCRLIEEKLMADSQGMFLWVAFQIDAICELVTENDIVEVLDQLPKSLEETYNRVLRKLHEETKTGLRKKLFQFVVAAHRPLDLDELAEALSVVPGKTEWDAAFIVGNIRKALLYGGSLLEVDELHRTVHFAHPTIRHHLLSAVTDDLSDYQIMGEDADIRLGEACVTYLSFGKFETQLTRTTEQQTEPHDIGVAAMVGADVSHSMVGRGMMKIMGARKASPQKFDLAAQFAKLRPPAKPFFENDGFLAYAKEFWLLHTRMFQSSLGASFGLWQRLISGSVSVVTLPWSPENLIHVKQKCVQWTSYYGHAALAEQLLFQGCENNSGTVNVVPLLSLFYPLRHESSGRVVGQIQQGNIRPKNKGAILICAAMACDLDLVRHLIENEHVPVDSPREGWIRTALQAASYHNSLDLMEYLISKGADVNAPAGKLGCALSLACVNHSVPTETSYRAVALLLDHGANIHAGGGEYGTALQAALTGKNDSVIDLILSHGADEDMNSVGGCPPLTIVAKAGDLKRAQEFIIRGADVNIDTDPMGESPLMGAIHKRSIPLMQLLLSHGANVNLVTKGLICATAMTQAAREGFEDGLELLLRNGGNVNELTEGCVYKTPLYTAVHCNHENMVQRLLDAGADPNPKIFACRSPVHLAVSNGFKNIVKLLLDHGADPIRACGWGRTLVDAAREGGDPEIIEMAERAVQERKVDV